MPPVEKNETYTGRKQREHGHDGIYEEIPFGVWTCNPDGGLRYASDSFLELLGMSMEEASGLGWTERIAQESMESVERWNQCVQTGEDWDDEHQIRDQQGELRTLLARGHAVRDEHGQIEHWIGVHLDITERKQAEQRLEDAHNFAQAVIETAADPLVVLDPEHRVVTANPAFYSRFETEAKATEGRPLHEIGNGQWDIPDLHRLLEEVLQEHQSFDGYEVEHDFPDIGRKVMLLSGRRVQRQVNHTELTVLAIHDISEMRQKEDRLRIVQETQAIEQERDRLAHRLHDHIQQLLHGANLHVAVMREEESGEEKREGFDKIDSILQEAGNAARDLAIELTPPVLSHSGLMDALAWLADWVKDKHRLHVDLDIDPDVRLQDQSICLLLFDTVRELLLNVAKHSGAESAKVSAARKDADCLQIVVQDDGKGCDLEQPKSKDDSTSGFGLSSIRKRIESVGGTFVFDSAVGQGTTATIRMPFRQE